MYSLRLLGVIALEGPSGPVSGRVAQRRRLALLALLGAAAERGWTRERLVGLLWPDASDEQARHLLSDSVYVIRQALGEDSIITSGDVVRLNPGAVATDIERFEAALKSGELSEAVELYRGPFLDGFHVGDVLELERWVEGERSRLAGLYAKALEALAQQAEDAGEHATAVGWWQRLAAHAPYDSRTALRLMQALANAGNPAGALEHARVHELLVREELGAEPPPELMKVVERLMHEPRPVSDVAAETSATIDRVGAARAESQAAATRRLVREIHRRFLWQLLLVYVIGAWVSYEIIEAITNRLALPTWLPVLALILFVLGLPFVLTTAFVQKGLPLPGRAERTPAAEGGGARRLFTWRNAVTGGVVALALWGIVAAGWLVFGGQGERPVEMASLERKSIAVLPLANLSGDAENDPFVNGIHDDIVTHLHKIGDLRPISRTSVMEYKATKKNLRQIAEELGVATVLEGGVQRWGDRVRMNVQLIDAETDEHIWAEAYEVDLTAEAVFTIQTDIARRIAVALKAQLTPAEQEGIAQRPTDNLEAYEYYLRARAGGGNQFFDRAVELDPDFAVAWAEIAKRRLRLWFSFVDPANLEKGVEALNRAIDLAPDAFETHMAQAEYHKRVTLDPLRQLEHLQIAETLRPNDAALFFSKGETLRFAGRWDEALAAFEKAAGLDPLSGPIAAQLGYTSWFLGRFADAERYFDRVVALATSQGGYLISFLFLLEALGDTTRARQFADQHPELSDSWEASQLDYVRRDYDKKLGYILSGPGRTWELPKIYYLMNDRERLRAAADSMRRVRETQLAKVIEAQAAPNIIASAHHRLGIQYAYLGEREAAIREAEQTIEKWRVSVDAWWYGNQLYNVANIYIVTGEHDRAIDLLETMLSVPGRWKTAWLRLDPFYDPLRDHPRFQALLQKYDPRH